MDIDIDGYDSFQKHIRELVVAENLVPAEAARVAIERTSHEVRGEMLYPFAVDYAKTCERSRVRSVEKEVDRRIAFGEDRIIARRRLVREGFPVDGRWVSWLDATADDHRERAAWQRRHATACLVDADRHEQAAEEIEAAGVVCLRDLDHGERTA